MPLKYLPNILTSARLCLIAPFVIFFYQANYLYALYIFMLAGFTDALDGWLARTFNWQSVFGLILDPIADKLLIITSLIALALVQQMPLWLVELVIFRDLSIVLGVFAWFRVMHRGLDFKPSFLSKLNTVIELFLILYCLCELFFAQSDVTFKFFLIGAVAATTTVSYVEYMWMWAKKAALNHAQVK